jgi:integrase
MPNKQGHRRFGNVRQLASGRFQIRYPGPDGRMRTGPETYARSGDARRALTLIEAEMLAGEWADPKRGKVRLADYAARWIAQRPGLRPRTVDLYSWLLDRYVVPQLGAVPLGKLSTPMIREWRAGLLGDGVSVSMAAKSYRLLRAVLATAVEEDKILARNPCRIRGAGEEQTAERPVLTVAQVFDLADRVGRRPVGSIRKLPSGGYRLRFSRHGVMRRAPEVYRTRADAERALWRMADRGQADCDYDRRFRANFNRMTGWKHAVEAVGLPGVHFHDLRHTGNTFAAASGIGIKDLMARMGHDSERAAMIYQHEARGADRAITSAIDAHVEAERGRDDDRDDGLGGVLASVG